MLMTVLKGPLAVKQSKALIRTFKKMKDYNDFADDVGVQNNHGRFLFKRYWRSGIGGISLG